MDSTHEGLIRENKILNHQNKKLTSVVLSMLECLECKDGYTHSHSKRVGEFAVLLAIAADYQGQCDVLKKGCLLHDIGKIAVMDSLLKRKSDLSNNELKYLRTTHEVVGYKMLAGFDEGVIPPFIAGFHHTKFCNLDDDILNAKLKFGTEHDIKKMSKNMIEEIKNHISIARIADCFDAIVTERPYHPKRTLEEGKDLLRKLIAEQHVHPKFGEFFLNEDNKKLQTILEMYPQQFYEIPDIHPYDVSQSQRTLTSSYNEDIKYLFSFCKSVKSKYKENDKGSNFIYIETLHDKKIDPACSPLILSQSDHKNFISYLSNMES